MKKAYFRGQGALEYLLIISVVILICAVVIMALPSLLTDPANQLSGVDNALNSLRGFSTIVINNVEGIINGKNGVIVSLINTTGADTNVISVNDTPLAPQVTLRGGGSSGSVTVPTDNLPPDCQCNTAAKDDYNASCKLKIGFSSNGAILYQIVNLSVFCFGLNITTCSGLQAMANNLDGNYTLMSNIDCSETKTWNDGNGFMPIGDATNKFTGDLNGNNFDINALYINRPDMNDVGLIGYAGDAAKVVDLALSDLNVTGNDRVGGFFGTMKGSGSGLALTGDFFEVNSENNGGFICGELFNSANTTWVFPPSVPYDHWYGTAGTFVGYTVS